MASQEENRDTLAASFAVTVEKYQQDHRALMQALRDDAVSVEEFERLSDRIHQDVNALKRLKAEMKRLRAEG